MIPDKDEDIKPRFHKSKVHNMHNGTHHMVREGCTMSKLRKHSDIKKLSNFFFKPLERFSCSII